VNNATHFSFLQEFFNFLSITAFVKNMPEFTVKSYVSLLILYLLSISADFIFMIK